MIPNPHLITQTRLHVAELETSPYGFVFILMLAHGFFPFSAVSSVMT